MRKRGLRFAATAVLLVLLAVSFAAGAEEIGPDLILRGEIDSPLKLTVSEPVYSSLAQFGEDRLASLNKLMKHLGISVNMDGAVTETTLLVDGGAVFSFTEAETEAGVRAVYSFEPDKAYASASENVEAGDPDFSGFLSKQFFFLNRMLDDLYPMFEKAPKTFADYSKKGAENLSYRGYGKAVSKITIRIPDDYVKEHFPKALTDLAQTDETRRFIEGLVFSGTQRITLLYDENGKVLRINYDGVLGQSEESMRKVSLVWRCLRTDGVKKDNVAMKTPAVKGNDRYNMTYVREYDLTDPALHTLNWDFQLDLKAGDVKKKVTFKADLTGNDGELSGQAVYTDKANGLEKKVVMVPAMKKENSGEYTGTLEITEYSGKIITSGIKASVSAGPGAAANLPAVPETALPQPGSEQEQADSERLQQIIESLLVRRLLALPESDLEFFSKDIPEDAWNAVTESLK